jgi:hypothetical protein
MVVLRNRRSPRMHPGCTDPLLKEGVRALAVHSRVRCFSRDYPAKRLDLKSLKDQTKAEEQGPRWFELLSLRLGLKTL